MVGFVFKPGDARWRNVVRDRGGRGRGTRVGGLE